MCYLWGAVDARAASRACRRARLPRMRRQGRPECPASRERRTEVVANGLPLWHGSPLALDATIVSPLTRRGDAHPRADTLQALAPNSAAPDDAALSSSAPKLAAGSTLRPSSSCASWRGIVPPPSPRTCDLPRSPPGWTPSKSLYKLYFQCAALRCRARLERRRSR